MRKTKIICTLGPAVDSGEMLRALILGGMDGARFNFSHGTRREQLERLNRLKGVRDALGRPVATILDTRGPEIRIRSFDAKTVTLETGAPFTLTTREVTGDRTQVSVTYPDLPEALNPGNTILIDDGLVALRVEAVDGPDIRCVVENGGVLSASKSINIPSVSIPLPALTPQDEADIRFGVENGVDYIACSFVSTRQDLIDVHNYLKELGADDIELIAKIENQSGVDHIEEICECCDGIMVARGDMGVEIPFEYLPAIQKKLITKCRLLGKRVITATEMLESMISNPRPTRAEISDIANAVYDGTSSIMLSGETAAGKYPVQAVATMAKIAETTESNTNYKKRFYNAEFHIRNMVDAISHSTCGMSIDIDAKAIVACSLSGKTARMVSRFRSPVPIIGLTTNERTWRKLALSWGVIPAMCETFTSTDVLFYTAKKIAIKTLSLQKGDRIVITGGAVTGSSGNTNLIKIEEI